MKDRRDLNTTGFNESRDGRSIKQILQDIVNHVSDIIRSEVRLARTEVRQDATYYATAGSWIGGAGVLALFAIGFVLLSAVFALQEVMPSWLAALLVGVTVAIVAAILYAMGRKKL